MKPPICISFETITRCCNGQYAGTDVQVPQTGHDFFSFLIKALEKCSVRICVADRSNMSIQHIRIWIAQILMRKFGFSEQAAQDVVLWEIGFSNLSNAIGFHVIDDRTLSFSGSWEQIANDILR